VRVRLFIMLLQPVLKNRHFFTSRARWRHRRTAFSVVSAWNYGQAFSGLILSDAFSLFFHLLLAPWRSRLLASESYLERENRFARILALLLFATAGMGFSLLAQELLTAFIGSK